MRRVKSPTASESPARPRAHFVPFYKGNPYQELLQAELQAAGWTVTSSADFESFGTCHFDRKTVVHLHWPPRFSEDIENRPRYCEAFQFVMAMWKRRLHGIRQVWTIHNLHDHESRDLPFERSLYREILRCVNRAIVHTDVAKRQVTEYFGRGFARKIRVVPHGNYIDAYPNLVGPLDSRARLNIASDAVVLLYFGNIRAYKGIIELISAFRDSAAACQRLELLIVGRPLDQSLAQEVQTAATSVRGIRTVLEYIPTDDVQLYMNACDAVVFPYRDILTSGALNLAMSFGRVCVAPNLPAFNSVLPRDGAVFYNPGDPDGLKMAIERVAGFAHNLRDMGGRNRDVVRPFTWSRVARETAQIYLETLTSMPR